MVGTQDPVAQAYVDSNPLAPFKFHATENILNRACYYDNDEGEKYEWYPARAREG